MDREGLEKLTREVFTHFDAKDFGAISSMMTAQAQVVDELTRRWLRGRADIEQYFQHLGAGLSDIRSTLSDISVLLRGDVAVVTCMLDQSYRYEGEAAAVTAPTTVVWIREDDWRIALVHTVELPPE